ncbi:MAG: hypothetical protein KAY37_10130 [Phycisphaerae bacterium]|nr:hypothetical protein [Phycisphaerae bacterium]
MERRGGDGLDFTVESTAYDWEVPCVYREYHIEFQLVVGQVTLFTLYLYCPDEFQIDFQTYQSGQGRVSVESNEVDTFTYGDLLSVEIDLDIPDDSVILKIDGSQVYSGSIPGTGNGLDIVWFYMPGFTVNDVAAVDNIYITGNSPYYCRPWIIEHPEGGEVCDGDSFTMDATADGTTPLSWQWQIDGPYGWENIPGATSSQYTIDPVSEGDEGAYRVVVSNSYGSANSNTAGLLVNPSSTVPTNVNASDGSYPDRVHITWNEAAYAEQYHVYRNGSAIGSWQTSRTYDDYSGTPGVTYDYAVASRNTECGESALSSADGGWRALSAPTGVSASDGTYTGYVSVTWNTVSGASHYRVYRNTNNNPNTATALGSWQTGASYNDSGATPGTTYYYWVKAATSSGGAHASGFSGYNTGWRALSAPSGVSATDGTYTGYVRVTWNTVSGASYYRVYRHTSNNSGSATAVSNWQTGTSYNDSSATPGMTFYYWVKAATSSGGAHASGFSGSNTGWRALSAPTNISASDGTEVDGVHVTWNSSAGASHYRVYRSAEDNPSTAETLSGWQTASSYVDADTVPGEVNTFYYWVRAATSSGGSRPSALSASDSGWRGEDCQPNQVADLLESADWNGPDQGLYTDPNNWICHHAGESVVPLAHALLENTSTTDPNLAKLDDASTNALCTLTIRSVDAAQQKLQIAAGSQLTTSETTLVEAGGWLQVSGGVFTAHTLMTGAAQSPAVAGQLDCWDRVYTNEDYDHYGLGYNYASGYISAGRDWYIRTGATFHNMNGTVVVGGDFIEEEDSTWTGPTPPKRLAGQGGGTLVVMGDCHLAAGATFESPDGLVQLAGNWDCAINDPARIDMSTGTLQLVGMPGDTQQVEVLAPDNGEVVNPTDPALFRIGHLQVGPTQTSVQLVNNHDNTGGGGDETLYVAQLELADNTTLVLDGANVYYTEIQVGTNVTIDDTGGGAVVGIDCNNNGVADQQDRADCDGSPWCSDCNTNGVLDVCDISYGTSPDCNTNGVPDECDIASGTSQDCNINGMPDECEAGVGDITMAGGFVGKIFELDPPYPLGSGNPNLGTMRNGVYPPVGSMEYWAQYDTFHNGDQGDEDWMGYEFSFAREFHGLIFQEGMHFWDGGWFDEFQVQVRSDGTWTDVANLNVDPPYPGNNGVNFETFTLTFDPLAGDAIRIYGNPGGEANFIGFGEYRVLAMLHPTFDCNTNGVLDECDIAAGTSQDDNGNGIPDECDAPPVCPGDSNCDGAINWRDIDFFVAAMNDNVTAWEAMFAPGTPSCAFENNDANADGTVNWRDIDLLVALMNTTCP